MQMIRRLKQRLQRMIPKGMTNRLFAIICAIGIFLTFILLYTVTSITENYLYSSAHTLLDNQARQIVNVFDQYMEILKNTVMTASRQKSIQSLINGNYDKYGSYLVYRDSYAYLKNVHEFYDWINIYVVRKDIRYIMSSNPVDVTGNYDKKGISDTKWYQRLENNPDASITLSEFMPPASSDHEHFAYALKIRDIYKWDTEGYIIAAINKNVFNELIQGTTFDDHGFILVLTPEGEVVYHSDPSKPGDDIPLEGLTAGLNSSGTYTASRDRSYFYSSWKSITTGWSFITLVDANQAKSQIFNFQAVVILIGVLTLLFLIIVARLSAKAYIKPINQLIRFIHEVEKKEFAGRMELEQEDEMGDLIQSFNAMVSSVRQNQVLRKKAEIDALEKQINPHFLFNTFQSIKALAQQNDIKGTISMIDKLSDMFHYNTNRINSPTTQIRNEVNHIRNYLDIQCIRFGRRLEVMYNIKEDILEYMTPRFILQPIVENSISHSMEHVKKGFRLDIEADFDGDDILFIIKDNGVGIPESKLIQLREHIYDMDGASQSDDFGIGLKNIQERLALFFEDGYGLTIDSAEGAYTEIQVRLPKIKNER